MTFQDRDPSGGLLILAVGAVWSLPFIVTGVRHLRRKR